MGIYYVAGVPYSDELYHHGIIGQKWGVRRYQNRDGSLTVEGRKHYGVHGSAKNKVFAYADSAASQIGKTAKKAGAAVGKAASATAKYAGKRFKMNHPSLMTDQELRDYTSRLIAEKNYSDMMRKTRAPGKAREFVGEVLRNGTKTLAEAGFRKLASEMTKSKLERENDDLNAQVRNKELKEKLEPKSKEGALSKAMSIINSPSSTASDIQEAKNILQNYSVSKKFMEGILGNANNKAAAAEVAKDVGISAPSISEPAASSAPAIKSGYAPAEWNRFKNWNMRSMESLGDDYRPSYTPPSKSSTESMVRSWVNDIDTDAIQRAILRPSNRPDNQTWVEQLDLANRKKDVLRRR